MSFQSWSFLFIFILLIRHANNFKLKIKDLNQDDDIDFYGEKVHYYNIWYIEKIIVVDAENIDNYVYMLHCQFSSKIFTTKFRFITD